MESADQNKSGSSKISVQKVSLPEGGGAIKGVGDSFKANSFSGAGTFSIPIPVSAARDFEPDLFLEYSSAGGNGVFGLGFSLSLSKISTSTNNGIPKYDGTDQFLLDGEKLIFRKSTAGMPNPRTEENSGKSYLVSTYLQAVETSYAQIEQWLDQESRISFWKVLSADNTTSFYGREEEGDLSKNHSRIANPDVPTNIFEWLIDESTDAKGNKISYKYKKEDAENITPGIYELNRNSTANRYIQQIKYGNYFDATKIEKFAFEIIFNYGEMDFPLVQSWTCRPDPFSSYHSGFEIRTYRLCQKIQLIHNFTQELGDSLLVKEVLLNYENVQHYDTISLQTLSLLNKVSITGFKKENGEELQKQTLPVLELGYSSFMPPESPVFKELSMGDNTIPGYLNATQFLPVDLNGEGLPGFLFSNADSSFYLEPLGDGKYKAPAPNALFPVNKNVQGGQATLVDLDGNGQMDLLVNAENSSGFYLRNSEGGWNNFVPFEKYPSDILNPGMESTDLDANGKSDLVLAELDNLLVYSSDGTSGYSPAKNIPNENGFPLKKNGYEQQLVTFADIFGDGLSHRVRISSGSVECWPCLGYGHFGNKVMLSNAPAFDYDFDINRLFLADVDGSGTTDLIYVYADRIELFINQSGNAFSNPIVIYLPELFDMTDQISFADILGHGTACLVFTKIAPVPRHYYYNFSGEFKLPDGTSKQSLKPYLLNEVHNNMGSVSFINYCSSTKFALLDKMAGRPWVTKLPFPVQVVEKLIIYDLIAKSRYASEYKYHDGFYDSQNKKFNGFGFVESWDTEKYEEFQKSYSNADFPVAALNEELFVPPVYTKTWYLNGAGANEYTKLLAQYRSEYFSKDSKAYLFPDSVFSPEVNNSDSKTFFEAYSALSGQVVRREIYADTPLPESANPYLVEESNYIVQLVQSATKNENAVFRISPRENITYHYERDYEDPRMIQQFVLETDPLCGQPVKSCSVALPRRNPPANPECPEQYIVKTTIATSSYFNTPDNNAFRLRGIVYDEQEFELLGMRKNAADYFTFEEMYGAVGLGLDNIIPYQASPEVGMLQAQQIARTRYYFWSPEQEYVLSLGNVSPRALLHHISIAAFTNDNIRTMYGERLTENTIQLLGGYTYDQETGYWENNGLIQNYFTTPESFYQPSGIESYASQLGMKNTIEYDFYFLAVVKSISYVGVRAIDPILPITIPITNETTLLIDYRVMAPKQLVDINGNVSQTLFDAMGQVIVSTFFGTENEIAVGGMRLYEYKGQAPEYVVRTTAPGGGAIDFNSVIQNPEYYLQGAAGYFYYDLNAFSNSGQPLNAISLRRENYYYEPGGISVFSCQSAVAYSDGLGRSIGQKQKADPENEEERWLTSGRVVYNNKGKVCEAYLPYFSISPFYQTQDEITTEKDIVPPPTVTHYDPLLRVIRIDTPKGFFSKVEFTPWQQIHSDEDDTVKEAIYYRNFMASYPTDPTREQQDEKDALDKAALFYQTPAISILDTMGNVIREIHTQENKRQLTTFYQVDIQGRKTIEIDPRLYASNLSKGTAYYNFKYRYSMGDVPPFIVDSADAGLQKHFSNIFGKQVWYLTPREYCQVMYYDWQQRQTQLKVKYVPGTEPISSFDDFNLVKELTYGETIQVIVGNNLRGQVYRVKDLSGIVINAGYSMLGNILKTSRQMAKAYKTPIDWKNPVELEPDIFFGSFTYNALSLLLSQTSGDGFTINNIYNQSGLLNSVTLTGNEKNAQVIIKDIIYNANLQRTRVDYGNGVTTSYSYEFSTLRLTRLTSRRLNLSPENLMQDISYTYDPVSNLTRTWDYSIETIFNNNQQVDPCADYRYDALYCLIHSSGRQHPGISSNTYKNNAAEGSFKQSIFSQLPVSNGQALENYREIYSYDDSGNLINKQHIAVSSSWFTGTPVEENSNRLKDFLYDASGNQQQLSINNNVSLYYNCFENMVSARIIERPEEANDADYYIYNSEGKRTRKVNERFISDTSCNYNDTIYLGNYELNREGIQTSEGVRTVSTEKKTVRIMDGTTCVAILYHWVKGGAGASPGNPAPDQLRYQLGNNIGSITMELDENALLVSYEEYFPYGGTSIISGANQAEVALKVYRYTGKECDDSTGLYYYGARYYVSWLGRWLNPDPIGPVDGLNLFAYVNCNPLTHTDPTGNAKKTQTGAAPAKKRKKFNVKNEGARFVFHGRPAFKNNAKKIKVRHKKTNIELNEDRRHIIGYDDTLRPMFELVVNRFATAGKLGDFVQQMKLQYTKHGVTRAPATDDAEKHMLFGLTSLNSVVRNLPAGLASQNQAIEHIRQQGLRLQETLGKKYSESLPSSLDELKTVMKEGFALSDGLTAISTFANEQRKVIHGIIDAQESIEQLVGIHNSVITSTGIDLNQATDAKAVNSFALQYSTQMMFIKTESLFTPDLNTQLDQVMSILSM
jgi:RHS repeat-associated protein